MTDYPRLELGERLYMDRNGDLRPAEEMDLPPSQPFTWKIHDYRAGLPLAGNPTMNRAARRKARYRDKGKGRITRIPRTTHRTGACSWQASDSLTPAFPGLPTQALSLSTGTRRGPDGTSSPGTSRGTLWTCRPLASCWL